MLVAGAGRHDSGCGKAPDAMMVWNPSCFRFPSDFWGARVKLRFNPLLKLVFRVKLGLRGGGSTPGFL